MYFNSKAEMKKLFNILKKIYNFYLTIICKLNQFAHCENEVFAKNIPWYITYQNHFFFVALELYVCL